MSGVIRKDSLTSAPPFSFDDLERRGREIVARAEAQARQILAEAEACARQRSAASQSEAYAAGLAQGRHDGMEQVRREAREAALAAAVEAARGDVATLAQSLAAGLAELDSRKHSLIAQAESGLIELALAIARRVCKTAVATSSEPACANVRALLEMARHDQDLELRVNPGEYELLQQVAADSVREVGALKHVRVIADPGVERGGCVLGTGDGTIEASVAGQLDRIAEAICETGNEK